MCLNIECAQTETLDLINFESLLTPKIHTTRVKENSLVTILPFIVLPAEPLWYKWQHDLRMKFAVLLSMYILPFSSCDNFSSVELADIAKHAYWIHIPNLFSFSWRHTSFYIFDCGYMCDNLKFCINLFILIAEFNWHFNIKCPPYNIGFISFRYQ